MGCGDDSSSDDSGGSTSGGSTTDASTTDPGTGSTSASGSSSTTDDSTTGSTTAADDTTSSTSGDGSSSTGDICDPGTQNCACNDGMCEGDLECIEDICYNPAGCQGEQADTEPNEDEGTAQSLPGASCGQLAEVMGSTEPEDVDWFSFIFDDLGDDCPMSDGTIAIATADEDVEVCMYFECDAGAASVNCGADSDATSPDGLTGCCGTNSVQPDFFCSGVNNDSEVRLRVGGLEANACVEYALAYRVR